MPFGAYATDRTPSCAPPPPNPYRPHACSPAIGSLPAAPISLPTARSWCEAFRSSDHPSLTVSATSASNACLRAPKLFHGFAPPSSSVSCTRGSTKSTLDPFASVVSRSVRASCARSARGPAAPWLVRASLPRPSEHGLRNGVACAQRPRMTGSVSSARLRALPSYMNREAIDAVPLPTTTTSLLTRHASILPSYRRRRPSQEGAKWNWRIGATSVRPRIGTAATCRHLVRPGKSFHVKRRLARLVPPAALEHRFAGSRCIAKKSRVGGWLARADLCSWAPRITRTDAESGSSRSRSGDRRSVEAQPDSDHRSGRQPERTRCTNAPKVGRPACA